MSKIEDQERKEVLLGEKIEAKYTYNPGILRNIPRSTERASNDIYKEGGILPFYGVDIWNCYEFSFLNSDGHPRDYILRIMYSSDSLLIVESKSLKLYLNSFNMTRFTNIEEAVSIIQRDLQNLLTCNVHVNYFDTFYPSPTESKDQLFRSLYRDLESRDFVCESYTRNETLLTLKQESCTNIQSRLYSCPIRSCCKVTKQPDFGDIYIAISGKELPNKQSLYEYLVSYRNENHFHEEIVEQVYSDLYKLFQPKELVVFAKYTRRGGIDINPFRCSHQKLFNIFGSYVIDNNIPFNQSLRQ